MARWISIFLDLTKFKISLFSTLSTLTGFILARRGLSGDVIYPVLGVFLLASGSCALNQYQERQNDQRMERTRGRPLPSKKLSPSTGLTISISLLLLGLTLLYFGAHPSAFCLGMFALFWYNGVYTPLKKKTAFAAIPGALVGAIPPFIGWFSGKSHLSFTPQILSISFFFFIWQVPHFWLLLLNSGRDYEKAGFSSLNSLFSSAQLSRVTFIWIFATATACMMMPLFGIIESQTLHGGLFIIAFWLIWRSLRLLTSQRHPLFLLATFKTINIYAVLVAVLIMLDHLLYE